MAFNYRALVQYDGAAFSGWQVQPNARTVQGAIEAALATILQREARIIGAGRTDAGVHALGQVFSFQSDDEISADRVRRSLTQMLGPDVRVVHLDTAPNDFHAQYSATGKRYSYVFSRANEPDPFTYRYAWHVPHEIDPDTVSRLAQDFVGEHDFAGYQGGGASVQDTRRTVHSITFRDEGVVGPAHGRDLWRLDFHGTGFLYKMIRNIVGAVVDVARGYEDESRLRERLASAGPFRGHTAPAHGLFLVEVEY